MQFAFEFRFVVALFLLWIPCPDIAVAAEVHDEIISTCRRYLVANGDDKKRLAARIEAFDGDIEQVIAALSKAGVASDHQDESGVLASQSFTHPGLKQTHPFDLLHYFVPETYQPTQSFGLLIFMHGGGGKTPRTHPLHVVSHPDDDPGSVGLQPFFKDLPFIIVAPSAPWNEKTGARWNVPEADAYISAVIEECRYRFHIDEDRVFLGGYSMGGFGAFHLGQRLSDRLAGAVVFSGAWKTTHWKAWRGLPVFIRHGVNDAAPRSEDGKAGRPRYTDVFYARAAHQRLTELAIPHLYVEDKGGHAIRPAADAMSKLADWIQKPRRDPFARHVVAISPRGWKAQTDTPTPHNRWVTIHEIGTCKLDFDQVMLDGPAPAWKETREDFEKQSLRLNQRRVEAGLVDAQLTGENGIRIRTENVKRISIWLHPSMVDFSKLVRISLDGIESQHTVKGSLLDALRSYPRRHDWRLTFHAEIKLNCSE